jgi:hypothetical protein
MRTVRIVILSCIFAGFLAAQPSLRITSPADGTTVHPGESLTVTVEASPPEAAFAAILVGAPDPLGFGEEDPKARPYRFTFQIPEHAPPKKYSLTAMGTLAAPPRLIYSNSIDVVIERADSPVSITVYPVVADFTMDQKRYLQVTGLYADKTTADLTQSTRIEYASSDPDVAAVDSQGIVSPVAPGSAKITVTYGDLKQDVPVRVRGNR